METSEVAQAHLQQIITYLARIVHSIHLVIWVPGQQEVNISLLLTLLLMLVCTASSFMLNFHSYIYVSP